MSRNLYVFLLLCPSVAFADSLLTAQSFPKTFNDLSFSDRVNVLTDGYLPFETVFDSSGNCVSGCPYTGITLAEVKAVTGAAERAAEQDLQIQKQNNQIQRHNNAVQEQDNRPQAHNNTVSEQNNMAIEHTYNNPSVDSFVPTGLPLRGTNTITSCYKIRWNRPHNGIDVIGNQTIYAVGSGNVVKIVNNCTVGNSKCGGGYGNYVEIKHNDTYTTKYAHLSNVNVKVGDRVTTNTQIGIMGNTGHSTGKHLHFEILRSGIQINPRKINSSGYTITDKNCIERDN